MSPAHKALFMSARTLLLGVSTLLLACGGGVAVPDADADADADAAVSDAGCMRVCTLPDELVRCWCAE
jgi:hypothetical protein